MAVKLFSDGDLSQLPVSTKSLAEILALLPVSNVEVLVVDAPTRDNTSNGDAGITAFDWAGKAEREKGRRVIHVSSLGSFAEKQTARDQLTCRTLLCVLLHKK